MIKTVTRISNTFRAKGNIPGLLALPVTASLTYAFCAYVFPGLSPVTQNAIENGGPGMILGMLGGAVLVGAAYATWQTGADMMTKIKAQG